ncbi:hypothetical protein EVAR_49237_1 [Eumeta japonica]|uniref:Uncharacterized protein n=1 Tax=Eumeta variegata TaxID=151549 RepID=A0A4C1YH00_EUMVA|nr:hypothetical protein EVAR_49237_1 [Eumeta japonica]
MKNFQGTEYDYEIWYKYVGTNSYKQHGKTEIKIENGTGVEIKCRTRIEISSTGIGTERGFRLAAEGQKLKSRTGPGSKSKARTASGPRHRNQRRERDGIEYGTGIGG